ncbi:Flagellar hook protein FlgE [Methylobacterium hispanicum]|jgi:flagellar hook protein FlgE|uniref:Flagellar hook protein FlgE n=1 Tax=Methylobacterium hispanicum TaxID=270350 RepID=A0AAV4ZG21_9HYPH|nr:MULTISPECIES: flagellar hook-basal body complex protein [Methylobacterium]GJD86950.1 Flagellar hook protein FlgE [Methylobacterium hispanicum]
MDIFAALQTSVSGLKSQSYAIGNISGNIANSQTTGYKRIDTSFVDLIADQTPGRESAGSVFAQARLTNAMQGNVIATQTPTNMAIQGSGFFVVQNRTGDANGQTAFTGVNAYTRRGDFSIDKEGYLVNGGGAYLLGQNIDPATGVASVTQPIKLAQTTLNAKGTKTLTLEANLPLTPKTSASATSGVSTFTPVTQTTGGKTQIVYSGATTDVSNFINNSIAGPGMTVYTESGAPLALNTRWVKTANADATKTPETPATWQFYYQADTTVDTTKSNWVKADQDVTFDSSGKLKDPATGLTFTPLTINNAKVGAVTMKFNAATLTQFSADSGEMRATGQSQDGYGVSTLNDITITGEGKITGTFSNGSVVTLANVAIARFTNPDGLSPDSKGNYKATDDSGPPLAGLVGSSIQGGSIEQSNTDIADEFSKMIVTQQAYSANTRVMSTAQQMMSDLINIVR